MSITIQKITEQPPVQDLAQIGIQIQPQIHRASRTTQTEEFPKENDLSLRQNLSETQDTDIQITTAKGQVIQLENLNKSALLSSLDNILQHFNLASAQSLQNAVGKVLENMPLSTHEEAPVFILSTGDIKVTIDPSQLTDKHLTETFQSALSDITQEDLNATYDLLKPLTQNITQKILPIPQKWTEIQAWGKAVDFQPLRELSSLLKFNPFNETESVHALLKAIEGEERPISPSLSTVQLEQSTQELIEKANQLSKALILSPVPDSPDILDLFRAFMAILETLDQALNALLKAQLSQLKTNRKALKQFAEQLHTRLKLDTQKREALHQNQHAKVQWGLYSLSQALVAKGHLAISVAHPEGLSQQSLEDLVKSFT